MSWGDSSGQTPYDPNNPYAQQQPQQPQNAAWGQQGGYPQQPMPDQSGYGQAPVQQPYPYDAQSGGYQQQPGYGQPAYGQPQYPNYAPPKKANGTLIATVVAAVLVAGGGITAAVMLTGKSSSPSLAADGRSSTSPAASTSSSPKASSTGDSSDDSSSSSGSLHIPSSVSGLTLLNDSDAKSTVSSTRDELTQSDLYPDPVVAAYNDDGDDEVTELFEAQAISQLTSEGKDELSGYDPSSFVATMMKGSDISNAEDEDTTASDGALSCGSRDVDDADVVFCYWDDDTSFGGLEVFFSDSLDDAASTADEMRAAAESG